MKNLKEYYIGLDIGTASVGWAVTDESYNIPKFNGKKMWGVRLFDDAKTAEERRTQRSSRRRLNRRKERINLLQNLFATEISKVDPNFFLRLDNSDLYREDKDEKLKSKYTLFNDKDFKDRDYHKKYPTIHHLIMDLIEDEGKKDVRLLYLACHYLLKNRGHFIFEGQKFDTKNSFDKSINDLKIHLRDEYNIDLEFNNEDLIKIITDTTLNKTNKKKELKNIVGDTKFLKAISAIMIGSSQKLVDLFEDGEFEETTVKSVDFSTTSFDDKYSEYEEALGDTIALLNILKSIYDSSILENLLKDADKSKDGNKYISKAFVKKFNKHGKDLKNLKRIIKKYLPSEYANIFRNKSINDNYVAYTKSNITSNKRTKAIKFTKQEDFYKFIKKYLETIKETKLKSSENEDLKLIDEMLMDIEFKTFIPKLKSSDNGVIPYQLKLMELKKILDNQAKYYDFLNESDEYGTVKDKVESIMEFRIPYYVGPLNPDSKYAWIKRENTKITPWNFKDIVDLDSSREEFIDRLIGRCTYLKEEKVLPKSSLLYNEFMVLNELNNLRLNSFLITEEMKKAIFEELFKTKKKVTLKAVSNLLKKEFNLTGDILLSGTDGDFKQGLNSYIDFKNIIGDKVDRDDYRKKIEEIIKLIVLYEDDKTYLKKKIKSAYKNDFTDDEIKKIAALNYKDWGRLSKRFLTGIEGVDKTTGERGSIIYFMREYNLNLMELMSGHYTFTEEVEKLNPVENRELCYEMVDELYLSPSVKRMLWQSLRVVDEIKRIIGKDPKKIFIEMARAKEAKNSRKESRKNKLLEFYKFGKKAFINEIGEERYNYLLNEINSEEESKFRWDNLYLYYTQLGRCMYSLEPIDLDDLKSNNIYDQDHIYPKSKIYDDSLENRVLVKKNLNHEKGNQYPIPEKVLNKNAYGFWKILFDKGLIGQKKYTRLTRRTPFEERELAEFIERQIVETRQATKETANLLKNICQDSEIVYSKAENASRFRQEFDIIKCRTVNDLHHMHDAYLNIVVGNVYNTKFTKNPINFIKDKDNARSYNLENMFKYDVVRGSYTAWIADDSEGKVKAAAIKKIKRELECKNYRFTRMSYIGTGGLYDQNLMRKGKGQIPQKENTNKSNIEKYGGYNKASSAYFALIESDGKEGRERTLETIPIMVYNQEKYGNTEAVDKYLKDNLGLQNPKILKDKIKINSLIKLDGFLYNIKGKTGDSLSIAGSVQLIVNKEEQKLIKKMDKFLVKKKDNKDIKVTSFDNIKEEELIKLYKTLSDKLNNGIYSNKRNNQAKNISEALDKFKEISIEEKIDVLNQIILLFQSYNNGCNLKSIGLSAKTGVVFIPKKLNYKECKLVNQSITGLFENEVDLLEL